MKSELQQKLPKAIHTVRDAEALLLALMSSNKFYHLDDNPADIGIFTDDESETLNRLIGEADQVTRKFYGMEERPECLVGIWEGLIKDLLPIGYLAFSSCSLSESIYVYNDSKVVKTTWTSWYNMKLSATNDDEDFSTVTIDSWFRDQDEITT